MKRRHGIRKQILGLRTVGAGVFAVVLLALALGPGGAKEVVAQSPPCSFSSFTFDNGYASVTNCSASLPQYLTSRLYWLDDSVPEWYVVSTSWASCGHGCAGLSAGSSYAMWRGWWTTQGLHHVQYQGVWRQFQSWSAVYVKP